MREAKDRVMHSFCMETYEKIENLDTKTKILKNVYIRNAGLSQILKKGILLQTFHKKMKKIKLLVSTKIWKYDSRSGKCNVHASNANTKKKDKDSKTIKRRSTTLRLIESIPGIPMYVWKQNIVWFLVNTEPEASSDEVFRLFERQKPLPFDWVSYCHFHSMEYIAFFIQGLPEPWAILSIEHYCKSWECINNFTNNFTNNFFSQIISQ